MSAMVVVMDDWVKGVSLCNSLSKHEQTKGYRYVLIRLIKCIVHINTRMGHVFKKE